MGLPKPRYTWAEALQTAIALSARAIEEVRSLARQPGPRGADGFGFDDMTVAHDGERTVTLRFVRGDDVKEFPFVIPAMIYRGVFKEGAYERGDTVTWDGSLWHANTDTDEKPGISKSWQLVAKKGRDGKEGTPGKQGLPGVAGKDGKDLTQMDASGRKW